MAPLRRPTASCWGASVTYQDVTTDAPARGRARALQRELEAAYEELQSTVEELETTNEELQSTNEELETTNEELQSTNEELETMNEELQSTNEELETINDELRHRTVELNEVNAFLETILTQPGRRRSSCSTAQQHVQIWNGQARRAVGPARRRRRGPAPARRSTSACPSSSSRPMLRACLKGESTRQQVTLDAVNRRGKAIRCKVSCMALSPLNDGVVTGLILMMEPQSA